MKPMKSFCIKRWCSKTVMAAVTMEAEVAAAGPAEEAAKNRRGGHGRGKESLVHAADFGGSCPPMNYGKMKGTRFLSSFHIERMDSEVSAHEGDVEAHRRFRDPAGMPG
jgi:hypothetical protein